MTRFSSTFDGGMLHIETGLDQCGTVVDQTEDGDIAFYNTISVTEYNSGSSQGPFDGPSYAEICMHYAAYYSQSI